MSVRWKRSAPQTFGPLSPSDIFQAGAFCCTQGIAKRCPGFFIS